MSIVDRLKVKFIDINPEVISALTGSGGGQELKGCKFRVGDILKDRGTLYSPSNTIGNMDGGIDRVYDERIPGLENSIMTYINELHGGKMDIGHAQIVQTYDKQFPYVVFSPTVEYPGSSATFDTVYNSVIAALGEIMLFNREAVYRGRVDQKIERLLIPGLGTGYGGLSPITSAKAVRAAFRYARQKL